MHKWHNYAGFHIEILEFVVAGSVLLISGPAGIGKTTVCDRLLIEFENNLIRVVSATTRKPRVGEINGVDYYFLKESKFKSLIASGGFLEYEKIHGNYYGTLKDRAYCELKNSIDVLFNIDVNGAKSLQKEFRGSNSYCVKLISIFLYPNSIEDLKKRLNNRGTDKIKDITRRLERAKEEIQAVNQFDYRVLSKDKESDYQQVKTIYLSESMRA